MVRRTATATAGHPAAGKPYSLDWLTQFLSHRLTARTADGRPAFNRLHADLVADLADATARRRQRRSYSAPRGAAKTTVGTVGYALWSVVENREPLVLILSESGDIAGEFLAAIKAELAGNPILADAYPAACGEGPVWKADQIVTRNGCSVITRGAGGRIRGLANQRGERPTLVILDDPNEKADAYSPTLRRRKLNWLNTDIMSVGGPATNILCYGTPIHREAIVCELARNGAWAARSYKSVVRYPDQLDDLWAAWERLLMDLADPDRLATARAFYEANRTAMDAGADVLWPERESLYELMLLRATIGPGPFDSEKQDTPGIDGSTEWPSAYFDRKDMFFSEWPEGLLFKTQALDPSKGGEAKANDYQAHVRGAVGTVPPHNGTVFIECDLKRQDVTAMVGHAIDTALAFGADRLHVEENGTMGFIGPEFVRQLGEKNKLLDLQPVTHSEPKLARIRRAGGYLARRQIRVKDTAGGRLLVSQWRDVPSGEFDDGPDAAGVLIRRLERRANGLE